MRILSHLQGIGSLLDSLSALPLSWFVNGDLDASVLHCEWVGTGKTVSVPVVVARNSPILASLCGTAAIIAGSKNMSVDVAANLTKEAGVGPQLFAPPPASVAGSAHDDDASSQSGSVMGPFAVAVWFSAPDTPAIAPTGSSEGVHSRSEGGLACSVGLVAMLNVTLAPFHCGQSP